MNIHRSLIVIALLGVLPLTIQAADKKAAGKKKAPKNPAVSIFNGKDLKGWKKAPLGQATYEVVDGAIVGTTVEGSPNSFLLSEKQYGDFELTFEVKVDDGLNSGVQIRSRPKAKADIPEPKEGKKVKNSSVGRVFGPQVEIEMSPGQAGYIYGEATGFGWLSPEPSDKEHAHEYIKNGEWNQYRILAKGPRIQTWINGNKVADLTHAEIFKTHSKGHFGLQVHGIKPGTGPFSVRWRNIEVKESPQTPPSVRKDLPGDWYAYAPDPELFVSDGKGAIDIKGGRGYVWSKEPYGDFELHLEVKMSEGCNSGVFVRTDPTNPVGGGFEIQVMDTAANKDPGTHDFGALYDANAPSVNAAKPAGEWNEMTIRWKGPKLTVTANGKKIQNVNIDKWTTAQMNPDGSKNKFPTALKDLPRTGHIGFQNHGHDVWFRKVSITAL